MCAANRSLGVSSHPFGPVVRGGPEAGFHSPIIDDPRRARAFLALALRPGVLVSNGYRSFRNGLSAARNPQAVEAVRRCAADG